MPQPTKHPLAVLKQVPPFLVHAVAIKPGGRRRFTLDEITARSGLNERTYLRYARMISWGRINLDAIERVLAGTGVNPWCFERHRNFLRKYGHTLKFLNQRQRDIFQELSKKLLAGKSDQHHVEAEG